MTNRPNYIRETGATYVEAAISILIFMTIMISVIELMRFSFYNITLQHVLNESIRHAVVGDYGNTRIAACGNPNNNVAALPTALEAGSLRGSCVRAIVLDTAQQFGITLEESEVFVQAVDIETFESTGAARRALDICSAGSGITAGAGGDYLSVCIRHSVPVLLLFEPEMTHFAIGRNENFNFIREF